jgi:hypothetical protein
MGSGHALQLLFDNIFGFVDELLHVFLLVKRK